ncbi:thiamine pyrophosphokinase-like protein 1 [Lindgomyces ingoldianus]|uniref:Thiamine pyrophosphokinase-like protein 1 n=1 Tax=Lindgomyces ingoldianus TaxID=673940 RepID=A0ACB6RAE9_9PLEO|nr:thiamine pyrophosphokinase-like protein 1 [Lindgomyces ingoldianus]KAF2476161.1 thiamine pyrophosphokinase-like protein 1 [Lindgomyces ingoldianus]
MTVAETREFDPGLFLAEGDLPSDTVTPDLLILNQPIASFDVFARLWRHTIYQICADGGANRLYDMFEGALELRRGDFLPDAIHGDLDSLRDDVRAYYTSRGVDVSQDLDQYSTDFGKAMQKIFSRDSPSPQREVIVLGTLAGRVDQGLGLLHELIREESRHPDLQLWLFSESNVSFILKATHNIIQNTLSNRLFTRNVGLLPIYGPAVITTTGLEWDVKDWETQMGHQVSTSNHTVAEEVHVQTNAPILFTIERAVLATGAKPAQRR